MTIYEGIYNDKTSQLRTGTTYHQELQNITTKKSSDLEKKGRPMHT
jgi:hypothetical protein